MLHKLLDVLQSRWLKIAFLVVTLALCIWALASQWNQVVAAAARVSPGTLALSFMAGLVYVLMTFLAWRAVLSGFNVSLRWNKASRIFFVSQLGKYLPGGIWNFLAAAEMGKQDQIPRAKSVLVMFVSLLLSILTGILLGALALVLGPAELRERFWWVLLALPVVAAPLVPQLLNRILQLLAKKLGSGASELAIGGRGVWLGTLWTLLAWLCAGVQIWILATAMGWGTSIDAYLLATAAYSLAWAAGFLLVFAPAGVGVREAVLGVVLAPAIGIGAATAVVLLSRVFLTLVDLLLGAVSIVAHRIVKVRQQTT